MEVLAPAGSMESLTAAVRAGADAVYLGGRSFSARASAKNFSDEELKEAVRYCHARGVKVYLAVNTILLEHELPAALEFLRYACTLPVDAVLVQDTGLLYLLRKCAPELRVHASTQMSIHTPLGALVLEQAGIRRVVLSRELSLREIVEIHRATPVELEAFVHGALCMSVSGQCYFSAVLGSRSGNRGMCAQPCRLPFSAQGGTGHDLSLKDLSMIPRIGELRRAGVCSAKIEGRMKRPEYVAAAARACRFAADGEPVPDELLQNLRAVFSRSGFTAGYPDAKLGREMFGVRSKEDVTGATSAVFASLHTLYQNEMQRIPVHFMLRIQKGEPVVLSARDENGHAAKAEGEPPQDALHRPVDRARCEEQLRKTGGTPFYAAEISCEIGEGLSVPVSSLNALRRDVLEQLLTQRSEKKPVPFTTHPLPESGSHRAQPMKFRARFFHADLPEAAKQCELVYVPYYTDLKLLEDYRKEGYPVAVELPRGMFGMEDALRRRLSDLKKAGITDVWAGNLGAAALGKELGLNVHGGFSLNITNSAALAWYTEFGLADTELSFELTLQQAANIGGELPRGLLLYGRLPLMLSRNCPAANGPGGCLHCKTAPFLTDRKGVQFPVQCYGSCSEVLNSVVLSMSDRLSEVRNQDFGVLRFTTETRAQAQEVLERYFTGGTLPGDYTRGLYYRGIE
ncbi:MAG TPA: U32 family peptidase [Clostridiales bacterium]|nr:U32 family peptidase [Clostridiales bacterium]